MRFSHCYLSSYFYPVSYSHSVPEQALNTVALPCCETLVKRLIVITSPAVLAQYINTARSADHNAGK